MLTISRKSLLYRFTYQWWFDKPTTVTLCGLFWATLFKIGLISGFVSLLVLFAYATWVSYGFPLLIMVALTGCVFITAKLEKAIKASKNSDGVIATTLWGIKHKVCPIIKVE